MSPRLTDWTLALTAGAAFATGIISLISGETWQWFVFTLHGMFGLWLLGVVAVKVRRIWPRLLRRRLWDQRTRWGIFALFSVLLTLFLGIGWALGSDWVIDGANLLNWHIGLGLILTLAVSIHMFARAKPLRVRDVQGRRNLLRASALMAGGIALWPVQEAAEQVLQLPGASRRFTGSREANSFQGNSFPTSSWVSDNPAPISIATWQLRITGAVHTPISVPYAVLDGAGDAITATLDCTGGFYSTQQWQGMRIGRLLDQAGLHDDARFVSFVSVTGYRWSLPVDEARTALLATKVGNEPLSHIHGAPARLVAPGRRGFEWVKWISEIRILTLPDPAQILSIYTSSFGIGGE